MYVCMYVCMYVGGRPSKIATEEATRSSGLFRCLPLSEERICLRVCLAFCICSVVQTIMVWSCKPWVRRGLPRSDPPGEPDHPSRRADARRSYHSLGMPLRCPNRPPPKTTRSIYIRGRRQASYPASAMPPRCSSSTHPAGPASRHPLQSLSSRDIFS